VVKVGWMPTYESRLEGCVTPGKADRICDRATPPVAGMAEEGMSFLPTRRT
jgi:hypothetical protein